MIQMSERSIYENQQYILVTNTLSQTLYTCLLPVYSRGNEVTIILVEAVPDEETKKLMDLFIQSHLQVVCLSLGTKLEEVL